jgi:hypothetical protein
LVARTARARKLAAGAVKSDCAFCGKPYGLFHPRDGEGSRAPLWLHQAPTAACPMEGIPPRPAALPRGRP